MDNSGVTGRPEPRTCAKCDTPYAITYQTVRARGGERDLPFCLACWRRLQVAVRVFLVAAVFAGVLLAGGAAIAATTRRLVPLVVAAAVGTSAVAAAALHLRSARPRGV
jgi:hypothetical protein